MKISEWLDQEEAKGLDVSQIMLPDDLAYDEVPDETIFFKEINPLRHSMPRQSSIFYCRALWPLVLL